MEMLAAPALTPTMSGQTRPTRFAALGLDEIIKQALERFPSRTAVCTGERGTVTYREFADAARVMMRRFEEEGVRAGDAVVVKLGHSLELATVILATQLASIVYVPVDPNESEERLTHIVRSTGAKAIVNRGDGGSLRVEPLAAKDAGNAPVLDIAYIMHTSGSTGVPKGVPVSRGALLNLIDWYIDMTGFSEHTSISQLTRPTFDVSVPEFLVPFVTGGAIVLPSTSLLTQVNRTIEFLQQSHTQIVQLVPTLLRRFLGALEQLPDLAARFKSLKYMVCAGEALPESLARRFYAMFPAATLLNGYGPTECCVYVSCYRCPHNAPGLPMFIGKPVPNVDFYVLDDGQESVGWEREGELWIGGAQTSPAYVADEVQSNLRFARMRTVHGHQVLYRTGDYVVASRGHGLRFVGRRDDQIKYRGVRLEKGEITIVLDGTGLCADSAVIVVERDDESAQELACFVTPATADVETLKERLRIALPADRVPKLVLAIAALPHTPNGKLDQRALKATASDALNAGDAKRSDSSSTGQVAQVSLESLLEAIRTVTGFQASKETLPNECGIDSLSFLDIQLSLARGGLEFAQDVYHQQDLTIGGWASRIKPIEHGSAKSAHAKRSEALGTKFSDELLAIVRHIESRAPDTVTLHSSLVAMKNVPASELETRLLEAIERLSATSTVLFPAFTWSYPSSRCFHWQQTKSETGVLADLVMRALSGGRTKHPVYSMVVVGPRKTELCDAEYWSGSAFGDDSIFGTVSRLGGLLVGLGVSAITHVHRCELLANVPYVKSVELRGLADFGQGPMDIPSAVYIRDIKGRPEYSFLAHDVRRDMEELGDTLHELPIAGSYARLVDVKDMESRLVAAMRRDPYSFLYEAGRSEAKKAYPTGYRIGRIA